MGPAGLLWTGHCPVGWDRGDHPSRRDRGATPKLGRAIVAPSKRPHRTVRVNDGPFFGLYGYHLARAAAGGAIILAYWLPRWVSQREPADAGLLVLLGLAAFALVPGMPVVPDPRTDPHSWRWSLNSPSSSRCSARG